MKVAIGNIFSHLSSETVVCLNNHKKNIEITRSGSSVLNSLLFACGILMSLGATSVHAASQSATGFSTNFSPVGNKGSGSILTTDGGGCSFAQDCGSPYLNNGDPTAYYQETVEVGGLYYFHVIIGDPASGFAQESWTPGAEGRTSNNGFTSTGTVGLQAAFNPNAAGMERDTTYVNDPTFNSTAEVSNSYSTLTSYMILYGNLADPFNTVHRSGNGGADPSNAIFHMVLISPNGDMAMDVNKPFLDKKPIITQTVQDGGMSAVYVADMTKLSYSDMNTPINIINNVTFDDPSIPGNGSANFDMANSQQSDITAGRYTFTKGPGYGWQNAANGWDTVGSSFTLGTYSYYGTATGFDVYTTDWTSFFEYDQNAIACVSTAVNYFVKDIRQEEGKGIGSLGSCPGH